MASKTTRLDVVAGGFDQPVGNRLAHERPKGSPIARGDAVTNGVPDIVSRERPAGERDGPYCVPSALLPVDVGGSLNEGQRLVKAELPTHRYAATSRPSAFWVTPPLSTDRAKRDCSRVLRSVPRTGATWVSHSATACNAPHLVPLMFVRLGAYL